MAAALPSEPVVEAPTALLDASDERAVSQSQHTSADARISPTLKQKLITLYLIVQWIFLSATIIIYNKYILFTLGFAYPLTLVLFHMIFVTICTRVWTYSRPAEVPVLAWKAVLTQFLPIACFFAGSLAFANLAYVYISVAFIQILKASLPTWVLLLSFAFGIEKPSYMLLLLILIISSGVAVAALAEVRPNFLGLMFQCCALACESIRLVLSNLILGANGLKLSPLAFVYFSAPLCVVLLFVPWLVFEASGVLQDNMAAIQQLGGRIILSNASIAFLLNLATMALIKHTSALTLNVSGVFKDFGLILYSALINGAEVRPVQYVGYCVAAIGVAGYAEHKRGVATNKRHSKRHGKYWVGLELGSATNESHTEKAIELRKDLQTQSGRRVRRICSYLLVMCLVSLLGGALFFWYVPAEVWSRFDLFEYEKFLPGTLPPALPPSTTTAQVSVERGASQSPFNLLPLPPPCPVKSPTSNPTLPQTSPRSRAHTVEEELAEPPSPLSADILPLPPLSPAKLPSPTPMLPPASPRSLPPCPLSPALPTTPADPYLLGSCAYMGTVIGMVATNHKYFKGIAALADRAQNEFPCVLASISYSVTDTHPRVRTFKFPLAAWWKPEPAFCRENLSGWRHAAVLKTQLLLHVVQAGFNCLMVDSDWSPVNLIGPVLTQLNANNWDVAAILDPASDEGTRLLNIGLLWVRSASRTANIVARVANRSYVAWDQLIFNQEVEAAIEVSCCTSTSLLQQSFARGVHLPESNDVIGDDAKRDPSSQEGCDAGRPNLPALPPPSECASKCRGIYPRWDAYNFNGASRRWTTRCSAFACESRASWPPIISTDVYHIADCVVKGTSTIIGMSATSDKYFHGIVRFAQVVSPQQTACVLGAVSDRVSTTHELVKSLLLPIAASWKPEPYFCDSSVHFGSSGWRHSHVLRAGVLALILRHGYDTLIVDSDYHAVQPLRPLFQWMREHQFDAASVAFDDSQYRHLNIGCLWTRNTPQMRLVAERTYNRSYAGWDQLLFNQEVESMPGVTCCRSRLMRKWFARNDAYVRGFGNDAKYEHSAQESCDTNRPQLHALPPPAGCTGACATIYPTWNENDYNHAVFGTNGMLPTFCRRLCEIEDDFYDDIEAGTPRLDDDDGF